MLKVRRSADRGLGDHGWLKSRHTFSFADYHDEAFMGFGPLRVINEDRIAGGTGFGAHPHRDMEIISYVLKGALRHEDSLGNRAVIKPGEVQRMSAGTGVVHSEQNDTDQETHFLQIWIVPAAKGVKPGYGQKNFSAEIAKSPLVLAVSKEGRDGSIAMNQDADLYLGRLGSRDVRRFAVRTGRLVWVQVLKGSLGLLGEELSAGDGAAVSAEATLELAGREGLEFLLFDLPG
jgi:redox-sensitive bicupin YhaK (pirin superfamily)